MTHPESLFRIQLASKYIVTVPCPQSWAYRYRVLLPVVLTASALPLSS